MTGFGGAFLRADDPEALHAWYERHLGIARAHGSLVFPAEAEGGQVLLAFFAREDRYFPAAQAVMLNLRVGDLDGVLDRLAAEGVEVDPEPTSHDFGRFGWITDPEGNRVELWQPAEDRSSTSATTITVPTDLRDALLTRARREGRSTAEVVRGLLESGD